MIILAFFFASNLAQNAGGNVPVKASPTQRCNDRKAYLFSSSLWDVPFICHRPREKIHACGPPPRSLVHGGATRQFYVLSSDQASYGMDRLWLDPPAFEICDFFLNFPCRNWTVSHENLMNSRVPDEVMYKVLRVKLQLTLVGRLSINIRQENKHALAIRQEKKHARLLEVFGAITCKRWKS